VALTAGECLTLICGDANGFTFGRESLKNYKGFGSAVNSSARSSNPLSEGFSSKSEDSTTWEESRESL
jgi:hypothetical protein